MSEPAADPLVLDCRGRRCPLPIIDLGHAVTRIHVGARVTVEADDPAAGPDIRAWCRLLGHEFIAQGSAPDGTPSYTIRRLH